MEQITMLSDYNVQRNVNIVIGESILTMDDFGIKETRVNKRPVTYKFAEWYLNRYPDKPLYYYYINDITHGRYVSKSFKKLEGKVKVFMHKNKLF